VQEEPDQPQQPDESQEPAAEATPEEAPAAEAEAPAEAPAVEQETAEAAPAAAEAPAEEAEPAEQLSPRERRRRARATAPSEQRPPRSAEERARDRAEGRAQKGQARRRWRQKRKDRDSGNRGSASRTAGGRQDAGPSAERTPGVRKTQQGVVVSSKGDKTITVRIDRVGRHRVYGKVVRKSSTLHAHDERNEAGEGDVVRVVEARPLSRSKRWRLVQVLEKAR
jgi:small subunit ribosomal protein S17